MIHVNRVSYLTLPIVLLGVVTDSTTSVAYGASPTAVLEEVVVTSVREQYRGDVPVRELPQSVQVLSEETLELVGAVRLNDALDLASSIARQNTFGGLWDSFAIRGFAGDINVPGGYLVNGFNSGRGFGGVRDTSSVERIEILKGPGSALFGRGEPGGTVSITTKKPQFESQGSFSFAVGSYSFLRGEADYTGPLSDSLAFRINAAVEDADSFRDNVHVKRHFASPSVLFNVSDNTAIWYELEYSRQELPFDRGTVARNGQLGIIPNSRYLGEADVDGPNIAKVLGHQLQLQHSFAGDWLFLVGGTQRDTDLAGSGQHPDLAAARQPFLTPSNAAGISGDYLARQRRTASYDTSDSVWRAELSGNATVGAVTHHLLFGVDTEEFELDRYQTQYRPAAISATSTLANLNAINIFNPIYGNVVSTALGSPNVTLTFNDTETQKSYGVYLADQIDLTERFRLRVGGRYDSFKRSFVERRPVAAPVPLSTTSFSPQVGLVFIASDAITLYTAYAEGFRPNSGSNFQNVSFGPEETVSYEVGLKFASGSGDISGNAAVYRMKKTNVLTADPVNSGFSIAIGAAESEGLEFDISAALPGETQLMLAYAFTNAEAATSGTNVVLGGAVAKGDPLLNIPKHNASLLMLKDISVGDRTLTLGAGAKYLSKRLGQVGTTYYLPAYTVARALASYEVSEKFKITGEVTNLFDKEYYPTSFYALWTAVGEPRQFQLRANYAF